MNKVSNLLRGRFCLNFGPICETFYGLPIYFNLIHVPSAAGVKMNWYTGNFRDRIFFIQKEVTNATS